uniref:Uncharacterized protein n=1 Tax=Anguilla anguilla TaxID=7936 RepID=A0A0E9UCI7_ANGAN
MIINSSKEPRLLNFFQKKSIQRNKGEIHPGEKAKQVYTMLEVF